MRAVWRWYRNPVHLLLLSLNSGAVPAFLAGSTAQSSTCRRLGYIADAAVGMPFAAQERAAADAFADEVIDMNARDLTADSFGGILDSVDAVYVAGGETFVLLEALRSNGTGAVLTERVRQGLPYIGCSAGSIIVGPTVTPAELMDDRAAAPALEDDTGLHLIEQVVVPHADGKLPPYPPELIARILSDYAEHAALVPLRDDQALLVTDSAIAVIDSR